MTSCKYDKFVYFSLIPLNIPRLFTYLVVVNGYLDPQVGIMKGEGGLTHNNKSSPGHSMVCLKPHITRAQAPPISVLLLTILRGILNNVLWSSFRPVYSILYIIISKIFLYQNALSRNPCIDSSEFNLRCAAICHSRVFIEPI